MSRSAFDQIAPPQLEKRRPRQPLAGGAFRFPGHGDIGQQPEGARASRNDNSAADVEGCDLRFVSRLAAGLFRDHYRPHPRTRFRAVSPSSNGQPVVEHAEDRDDEVGLTSSGADVITVLADSPLVSWRGRLIDSVALLTHWAMSALLRLALRRSGPDGFSPPPPSPRRSLGERPSRRRGCETRPRREPEAGRAARFGRDRRPRRSRLPRCDSGQGDCRSPRRG